MAGGAGFRIEVFVHMVTVFPGRGEGQRGGGAGGCPCPRPALRPRLARLTPCTEAPGRVRSGTMKAMTRITPALLRAHPAFRRFWLGQTVSLLGDQVTLIALPLVAVLELHASAAQMGYLTAAAVLPNLVFSLPAGAAVDRYGHRRQADDRRRRGPRPAAGARAPERRLRPAVAGPALRDRLPGGQPERAVHGRLQRPVRGAGAARRLRGRHVAANGSRAFSFVAGPSIGGVLVQVLTAPAAVAVDAASFVVSAPVPCDLIHPRGAAGASSLHITACLSGGLRFIARLAHRARRSGRHGHHQLLQLRPSSRCSSCTPHARCTCVRLRWASCWAPAPWAACWARW